jgi:hypothetical protein
VSRKRQHVTFLGPLTAVRDPGNAHPAHFFLVLQAGGQSIKLEYANRIEARSNRNSMVKAGSVPIPTPKIFEAIVTAIGELPKAGAADG